MPPPANPSDDDRAPRLPAGRKAGLAAYVAEVGEVTVNALAARFGVSPDTVRRDLDQLDADGLLVRTHGGAISATALPRPDTSLDVRLRLQVEAKETIAALVTGLVEDGTSLMLNGGTTTLAVARRLRQHRNLTVATNNLRIPSEISPEVLRELYVFGGPVQQLTQTTTGPVRFHGLNGGDAHPVRCDLAVIAVGGVSVADGYSTSNLGDAAMMRDMMERSARVAVLADASKLGRRLFAQVAEIGRPDFFVTDVRPADDVLAALDEAGVSLVVPD